MKWGGAVAAVFLIAAWIGTGGGFASFTTRAGRTVSIGTGCFWLSGGPNSWGSPRKPGWDSGTNPWRVYSTVQADTFGAIWFVGVPLWMFAPPALAASAIAWAIDARIRRRASTHLCAKCAYDRTGLAPSAVCPECGAAA